MSQRQVMRKDGTSPPKKTVVNSETYYKRRAKRNPRHGSGVMPVCRVGIEKSERVARLERGLHWQGRHSGYARDQRWRQ